MDFSGQGLSFTPGLGQRFRNSLNGQLPNGVSEALQVLSLRLPQFLGGNPIAPDALLRPSPFRGGPPPSPSMLPSPSGPSRPLDPSVPAPSAAPDPNILFRTPRYPNYPPMAPVPTPGPAAPAPSIPAPYQPAAVNYRP
jgi:hypothetical protein